LEPKRTAHLYNAGDDTVRCDKEIVVRSSRRLPSLRLRKSSRYDPDSFPSAQHSSCVTFQYSDKPFFRASWVATVAVCPLSISR
jgi:hypothetical protein